MIASVTYDDPNDAGSWESWEPGGAWSNGSGGGQAAGSTQPKSEDELQWDEDGDTNLRDPRPLPRTLITTSELDWEDSDECATELWLHPQRRAALFGRGGQRPQAAAPESSRSGRTGTRANTGLRPTAAGRAEAARAPQTGTRPSGHVHRNAEPTARWRHLPPQRLPAAPPPRAAEPEAERRERTITQPGAAASQPPEQLSAAARQPPQQLPAAPRRALHETAVESGGPPQQLPAAPVRASRETAVDPGRRELGQPPAAAQRALHETAVDPGWPPQQLPAAPVRASRETAVDPGWPPQQLPAAPVRASRETAVDPGWPPQQLPAAPVRASHETAVESGRRELGQPPAAAQRALRETAVDPGWPPQQLPAAPGRASHETAVESGRREPPQQLPAAPRRALHEASAEPPPAPPRRTLYSTQVSGFGAAPTRETPVPGSLPRQGPPPPPAPAIEALRGKLESTQRVLPPPRPQNTGHIPTILGTPSASHAPGASAPSGRVPAPTPALPPGRASTSVQAAAIEHLQEQLLEAMARARVQEARAAEAEKSVGEVEEQLEAIVRSHMTETERLQEQLRLTTEQLRVSEARAVEAERRSLVLERPSNMLHLDEPVLQPRTNKQGRANLILSGLLASSLSFGGAAYFMFYAPLQKQVVLLEQQRVQDAQAQANALTNLKAQTNAERQGLEAQNAELRKQLETARAEATAAASVDDGRRGRSRRASADDAEDLPTGTRSARAIERRMRRSRSAPDEEAPAPTTRPSRPAREDSDDPLGGI